MSVEEAARELENLRMIHDGTYAQALTIAIKVMEERDKLSSFLQGKLESFPKDLSLYDRGLYDGYYNILNFISKKNDKTSS